MIRIRLAILVLGLLTAAIPSSLRGQESGTPCRIAHVLDGDTFNCTDGRKVRLLLVDAPDSGRFGNVARAALATLIPVRSTVAIETDSMPRDSDGRVLAYVTLGDGRLVNEILVREGFAFFKPSRENRKYAPRLRSAEELARSETRGVWSE